MIVSRQYSSLGAADYQSLPSSELLNQPDPNAAPVITSTGAMIFPPMVITGSASSYGTGPVNLPATAPVPLTEDEIAQAYGGNPIINVFKAPFSLASIPKSVLVGGVALVALGAMIYSGRGGKRGRRRRRRR